MGYAILAEKDESQDGKRWRSNSFAIRLLIFRSALPRVCTTFQYLFKGNAGQGLFRMIKTNLRYVLDMFQTMTLPRFIKRQFLFEFNRIHYVSSYKRFIFAKIDYCSDFDNQNKAAYTLSPTFLLRV